MANKPFEQIVEDWELPNIATFDNCTVYVDFAFFDNEITRIVKVHCEFADPDGEFPLQTKPLLGVPSILEQQLIKELESQLDDIVNFINQ